MLTLLLFLTVTVIATQVYVKKFKPQGLYESLNRFNDKYRVIEDLYLLSLLKDFFNHYIIQCRITKRFSLWYEFEKIATSNKNSDSIAVKYARLIDGKNFNVDSENSFKIESLTYKEFYDAVLRMSLILHDQFKVKKGDIVTLYFMNKPLFIIIWFALWNLGAIPAFINYNLISNPLLHCIKVVNSRILLVDNECVKTFEQTRTQIESELPNLSINIINELEMMEKVQNPFNLTYRENDKIRDNGLRYWDPAILVYTSGTTGLPKSAVNSWRKVFMAAHLFPHAMHFNSKSNSYTAMPLYHGTASILGVIPSFFVGGTISIGHKFSLSSYWTQVKLCDCNSIQYVGEVCRYLVESNETKNEKEMYGKIKLAYGNGLRPDIWMKLKSRFGIKAIGEFYSSSEAPFATTCYEDRGIGIGALRNNGYLADKFLSLQYTLVRMDPQDETSIYRNPKTGFCESPKIGENGEMIMKILNPKNIKSTFPGYINDDSATYSKIIRDVFKKGDAWVRSDDLMKKDEMGCIYFVDRMGDTYRWKSENVSTTEVENQLLEFIPEIKNCVVVGAKVENHEGRAGYALIQTLENNKDISIDFKREEILDKIMQAGYQHLPHFARPVFVTFENISFTDNHKISKKIFRDPVLPNGKNGNLQVYYLDSRLKKYKPLNDEIYNAISNGDIRL
jgi:acyl-CoA synthetase (AMP-forming)/AMP-acid ligase II